MVDHMAKIPHIVERLIGPGMILGVCTPVQDHAPTIGIAGIGEVVRKGIADIGDVLFLLA